MQIIRFKVPRNFNLFLFGDKHTGSILSHQKSWNKLLDMMESEYSGIPPRHNYGVDHGDCIEAIDVQDKRFDIATIGLNNEDIDDDGKLRNYRASQILAQAQQAVIERNPIRTRLVTILKGNHEHKVLRFGNMAEDICDRLKLKPPVRGKHGNTSAVIEYVTYADKLLFKHYAHHGIGGIKSIAHPAKRRISNRRVSLMQKFDNKFGDVLLNSMGHTHQLIVADPDSIPYMATEDGKTTMKYTSPRKTTGYIEPNHRWYVNTGSFRTTLAIGIDDYAERAGYDPAVLGFAVAKIRDGVIVKIKEERLGESHDE